MTQRANEKLVYEEIQKEKGKNPGRSAPWLRKWREILFLHGEGGCNWFWSKLLTEPSPGPGRWDDPLRAAEPGGHAHPRLHGGHASRDPASALWFNVTSSKRTPH